MRPVRRHGLRAAPGSRSETAHAPQTAVLLTRLQLSHSVRLSEFRLRGPTVAPENAQKGSDPGQTPCSLSLEETPTMEARTLTSEWADWTDASIPDMDAV